MKSVKRTNPSHPRYPWTFWARANWAEGEGANQQGTVFQTALFSLVIIPRLRPGLLSLRSVLSSRQTTWQHNHQTTKQLNNQTTKQLYQTLIFLRFPKALGTEELFIACESWILKNNSDYLLNFHKNVFGLRKKFVPLHLVRHLYWLNFRKQ